MSESRKVTICIKMVGIPVFDEELTVNETTALFAVKEHLVKRHGTTDNLRLWRDRVEPSTSIRDLGTSIRDAFRLASQAGNARVTLYYEFGTPHTDCPLLSA